MGQVTFKVVQATKPFCAAPKLCEEGGAVVLGEDRSQVRRKKTGRIIRLKKVRGVCVLGAIVLGQLGRGRNGREVQLACAGQQYVEKSKGFLRQAKTQL